MKLKPSNGILIAFGELFLKSEGVREVFRRYLTGNISSLLKKRGLNFRFHLLRERVLLEALKIKDTFFVIKNIFGISWFAECLFFETVNLKEISDFIAREYKNWIKKGETFALRLSGDFEEGKIKSINEIARRIERKVDLKKPKKEIFIEKRKDKWFIYFKKRKGMGGLPVGSGGRVLSLISGGIDSPVAAFLMAKRGAENVWLHFHSFPLVSKESIEKVRELAKNFLKYQPRLKIYFIPFHNIQMEIKTNIESKYRILLYRRIMLKMAEKIAKKENCQALVTGESLGQVSSQTLPNIRIIEEKINIPIFRPLISYDKQEIIDLAKKIKTFQISIKPQEDCCTLFVPKHATAKGKISNVKTLEKKLKLKKQIHNSFKEMKIEKYE